MNVNHLNITNNYYYGSNSNNNRNNRFHHDFGKFRFCKSELNKRSLIKLLAKTLSKKVIAKFGDGDFMGINPNKYCGDVPKTAFAILARLNNYVYVQLSVGTLGLIVRNHHKKPTKKLRKQLVFFVGKNYINCHLSDKEIIKMIGHLSLMKSTIEWVEKSKFNNPFCN